VWPFLVLVALEILARIEWPAERRWTAVRWCGLIPVGVVAAIVSYRHLSALLAFYGEDSVTTLIGPLAVDGIMLLASGALLAGSSRTAPTIVVSEGTAGVLGGDTTTPVTTGPALAVSDIGSDIAPDTRGDIAPDIQPDISPAVVSDISPAVVSDIAPDTRGDIQRTKPVRRRPSTAERIARLRDRHPDLSVSDIAKRVGVTDRTVSRHLAATKPVPAPDPVVVPDDCAELTAV
jgi:DNA-binding transcriptional ArsR family regulator